MLAAATADRLAVSVGVELFATRGCAARQSSQPLITPQDDSEEASGDHLVACGETAAMFESNKLRDDTSDVVSRTWNFRDASAPRSSTVLVISAGLVDRVSSPSPREIDLGSSAARAWTSAGSNSQQAGPSRRSGVRRGWSRRPWRLRSTEAPHDGRISRSRVRSVLSGPVPCHSARKRPRRPALEPHPSRI